MTSKTVSISNTLSSSASISSATFSGANTTEFTLADSCSGKSLSKDGSCNITVNFIPESCGSKSATLTVSTDQGNLTTEISGTACGTGASTLSGTITDAESGLNISGAMVMVGTSGPYLTDGTGKYIATGIAGGLQVLTVSKSGYDTFSPTITITPSGANLKNIRLTPVTSGLRVTSVTSKYSSGKQYYFLPGISFDVTFTAEVDWNGKTPGVVRFITSGGKYYDVPTTGTTASKSINVGSELDPCATLQVKAIAADSSQSAVKNADFIVTKEFYDPMLTTNYTVMQNGTEYTYKNGMSIKKSFIDQLIDADAMSPNVPFFGKNALKLQYIPELEFEFNGSTNEGSYTIKWSDLKAGKGKIDKEYLKYKEDHNLKRLMSTYSNYIETGKIDGRRVPKGAVGGIDYNLFPVVKLTSSFLPGTCGTTLSNAASWNSEGYFGLIFDGKFAKTRQFPSMGTIPVPWYIKGSLGLTIDAMVNINDLVDMEFNGEVNLTPSLSGTVGAGVNDIAGVEGTVKGSLTDKMLWSPFANSVKTAIDVDARMYAYVWEWKTPTQHWEWCLSGCSTAKSVARLYSSPTTPTLISRDYLTAPTQQFKRIPKYAVAQYATPASSYSVATSPVFTSVYPQSSPVLSSSANSVNLLWLSDKPERSAINRTILMHSIFDGSAWSTPLAVADNGTADFNPASLTFADGSVVAAWEDVKTVMPDTATMEEMTAQMEIATAIYNPTSKTWGTAIRLTDNATLERSPRLAGKAANNLMLTWIGNSQNDTSGNATKPNALYYALYNGTAWSLPQIAANIPNQIKRYSVVYDGTIANVALSLDTDDDPSTVEDLELYRLTYSSGVWNTLTRLTTDTIIDDNPQLAVDSSNDAVMTWVKGGELSSVVNFNLDSRTVIRSEESYSTTLADFKIATATDGKVGVIYGDTSENSTADLFGVFYDPIFNLWGQPKQLTTDAETEMRASIAFMGTDTIVSVFNRKLLINPDGTPTTGALTDLYMLKHTIGDDLALETGTLTVEPENAEPGSSVTISINAQNLGDKVEQNIPVNFYNGDPATGGTLIGNATITGPFKPGDIQNASITWTVPVTTPLTLFAVIDPASTVDTLNRSNNIVSRLLAQPDLLLQSIRWEKTGAERYQIIVSVVNIGSTTSPATTLTIRKDNATGTILTTIPVVALTRFASADYGYEWDASTTPKTWQAIVATIDEAGTIDESDKYNNSVTVRMPGSLAEIIVNPATLSFANTATGQSNTQIITIKNSGSEPLVVSNSIISGTQSTEFTVYAGGTSPCASITPTVAYGLSCTLVISAKPTAAGLRTATLSIVSNGATTPITIPLSVNGIFTETPPITYYHQTDGKVYGMTTDGAAIIGGAMTYNEANTAWSIVGQGDFNGDAVKDLVWWNSTTGQVYLQFMQSGTIVQGGNLIYQEPNTHWRIVATGDLDGNGKSDLIWWNEQTGQVYAMLIDGGAISGGAIIWTEPNTHWKIVATGDVNASSTTDLIWWNDQTGQVYQMLMNGASVIGGDMIYQEGDINWRIVAAGDLDGDGKADLVWHNKSTGQVYGMQLNGSSVAGGAMLYVEPNTDWEIVSVSNYNSDNKADLLWWNQTTGQVYMMPMNGLAIEGGAMLYQEQDTNWRIQGQTEWKDKVYGKGVTTGTK